ncbi:hypothetical protein LOZ80_27340 [Paenibacillus sp. HWE-109]|uniref:hypothetical protein n=1 Tax=Paenibacillus sp. HWE-109 TaxID=1306526 RepID=UPI001EDD47D3|nr:hypothetical protein [Paenibacillus sp. HWE-109]UKS25284.1 hypothetical protein LOZ80_27340 [Paenibacillus sp. HWE-109]
MKSRQSHKPRAQRKKAVIQTSAISSSAAGRVGRQSNLFASGVMGKYGFGRHNYLGLLALIFNKKGPLSNKDLAAFTRTHDQAWVIQLQLQLKNLQHPDSATLLTKKQTIRQLQQLITSSGYKLPPIIKSGNKEDQSQTNTAPQQIQEVSVKPPKKKGRNSKKNLNSTNKPEPAPVTQVQAKQESINNVNKRSSPFIQRSIGQIASAIGMLSSSHSSNPDQRLHGVSGFQHTSLSANLQMRRSQLSHKNVIQHVINHVDAIRSTSQWLEQFQAGKPSVGLADVRTQEAPLNSTDRAVGVSFLQEAGRFLVHVTQSPMAPKNNQSFPFISENSSSGAAASSLNEPSTAQKARMKLGEGPFSEGASPATVRFIKSLLVRNMTDEVLLISEQEAGPSHGSNKSSETIPSSAKGFLAASQRPLAIQAANITSSVPFAMQAGASWGAGSTGRAARTGANPSQIWRKPSEQAVTGERVSVREFADETRVQLEPSPREQSSVEIQAQLLMIQERLKEQVKVQANEQAKEQANEQVQELEQVQKQKQKQMQVQEQRQMQGKEQAEERQRHVGSQQELSEHQHVGIDRSDDVASIRPILRAISKKEQGSSALENVTQLAAIQVVQQGNAASPQLPLATAQSKVVHRKANGSEIKGVAAGKIQSNEQWLTQLVHKPRQRSSNDSVVRSTHTAPSNQSKRIQDSSIMTGRSPRMIRNESMVLSAPSVQSSIQPKRTSSVVSTIVRESGLEKVLSSHPLEGYRASLQASTIVQGNQRVFRRASRHENQGESVHNSQFIKRTADPLTASTAKRIVADRIPSETSAKETANSFNQLGQIGPLQSYRANAQASSQLQNVERVFRNPSPTGMLTGQEQGQIQDRVQDQIQEQVRVQAQDQLQKQVLDQIQSQMQDQVQTQVQNRVQDQIQDQVQEQIQSQTQEQIQNQMQNQVQEQIQSQLQEQMQNQVQNQVQNQIQEQVQIQVQDQIQNQIQEQVQIQVQDQVQSQMQKQVQDQIQDQIQNQLQDQLQNQNQNSNELNEIESSVRSVVQGSAVHRSLAVELAAKIAVASLTNLKVAPGWTSESTARQMLTRLTATKTNSESDGVNQIQAQMKSASVLQNNGPERVFLTPSSGAGRIGIQANQERSLSVGEASGIREQSSSAAGTLATEIAARVARNRIRVAGPGLISDVKSNSRQMRVLSQKEPDTRLSVPAIWRKAPEGRMEEGGAAASGTQGSVGNERSGLAETLSLKPVDIIRRTEQPSRVNQVRERLRQGQAAVERVLARNSFVNRQAESGVGGEENDRAEVVRARRSKHTSGGELGGEVQVEHLQRQAVVDEGERAQRRGNGSENPAEAAGVQSDWVERTIRARVSALEEERAPMARQPVSMTPRVMPLLASSTGALRAAPAGAAAASPAAASARADAQRSVGLTHSSSQPMAAAKAKLLGTQVQRQPRGAQPGAPAAATMLPISSMASARPDYPAASQPTSLEHKWAPATNAAASAAEPSALAVAPLEMDWLRTKASADQEAAPAVVVPEDAPKLSEEQLQELIKELPQLDIAKIADKVYREIEKKMKFERQRRGL